MIGQIGKGASAPASSGIGRLRILAGAVAIGLAALAAGGSVSVAQPVPAANPAAALPQLQAFDTPEAAVAAFVAAVRSGSEADLRKLFGPDFRKFAPRPDNADEIRAQFLEAYGQSNKLIRDGDKVVLEAGTTGWTLPVPIVKGSDGWKFDIVAGAAELRHRAIGRNELAAIQTVLAIADAQKDYAALDPMKTGTAQYARRLLSTPGRKDGLYWEHAASEPESPLGDMVARAQADGRYREDGFFGYHYRLLYAQGQHASGGARDYIIRNRLVAGFAIIATPARYGETGVMTFIVSHEGVVFEKDLGPQTATIAAGIQSYDPDPSWTKADITP